MRTTDRNLIKTRDRLKASAKEATALATSERLLADQQHMAARQLEDLAEVLDEQVVALEADIASAKALP